MPCAECKLGKPCGGSAEPTGAFARKERSSGDPVPSDETPAPGTYMDAETWRGLSPTQRAAWLRSVAISRREEQQLIADGLQGGFERVAQILSRRADVEIEQIRGNTRIAIARELGREASEDELLRDLRRQGSSSSSSSSGSGQYRITPPSGSSGAMLVGALAIGALVLSRGSR